jgi:hypothetical protein
MPPFYNVAMPSWLGRLLILAGLAAVLLPGLAAESKPKGPRAAPAECQADADCTLVTDGCCGCTEGGKQRAVPVKARDGYEKKRKAICRKTMCPQLMSEDQSCVSGHAVCKEGTCGLGS